MPLDVRTIVLKPLRNIDFYQLGETEYAHMCNWIISVIEFIENNYRDGDSKTITFGINIDRLSLFNKSTRFKILKSAVTADDPAGGVTSGSENTYSSVQVCE